MREVTILAFNYGSFRNNTMNGPGCSVVTFAEALENCEFLKVHVFSEINKELFDSRAVKDAINRSDIVHHWSGMGELYCRYLNYAESLGKKVIVGPNVVDTVQLDKEKVFLSKVKFDKLLTVNSRLKFKIAKEHDILLDRMGVLMVGPKIDHSVWHRVPEDNGKILWKGNSKQFVKDIGFALKVKDMLPQYEFDFIGYPAPYNYQKHIRRAKRAHLYFSTSLSETMGISLLEQWRAGIPSVTHPKIYLHGKNYETGIITTRTPEDYCEAIIEIMENDVLHRHLSVGAERFAIDNFSDEAIIRQYKEIVGLEE